LIFFAWFRMTRWVALGGTFNERKLNRSLADHVVVVTGANAGIGKLSSLRFAKLGARVVMCCRDAGRGQEALNFVKEKSKSSTVELMSLDLSSLVSVQKFCKEFLSKFDRLDVLLNNAGVMETPFGLTAEGHETQFGTNHLGHFLLTASLLRTLLNSKGRVVNVTSLGHWFAQKGITDDILAQLKNKETYDPWLSYGVSKLSNLLMARELHARYHPAGLTAASCHPGAVETELARHMAPVEQLVWRSIGPLFLKNQYAGAHTSMYCSLHPQLASGEYHQDCAVVPCSPSGRDLQLSAWLWDYSVRAVAKYLDPAALSLVSSSPASPRGGDADEGAKKRKA